MPGGGPLNNRRVSLGCPEPASGGLAQGPGRVQGQNPAGGGSRNRPRRPGNRRQPAPQPPKQDPGDQRRGDAAGQPIDPGLPAHAPGAMAAAVIEPPPQQVPEPCRPADSRPGPPPQPASARGLRSRSRSWIPRLPGPFVNQVAAALDSPALVGAVGARNPFRTADALLPESPGSGNIFAILGEIVGPLEQRRRSRRHRGRRWDLRRPPHPGQRRCASRSDSTQASQGVHPTFGERDDFAFRRREFLRGAFRNGELCIEVAELDVRKTLAQGHRQDRGRSSR